MFQERFYVELRQLSQRFGWTLDEKEALRKLYLENATWEQGTPPTIGIEESVEEAKPISFPEFQMLKVMELLGEGGMGRVYRVVDEALGRDMALKVLRPELSSKEHHIASFISEAQMTARLQHPGIVPIHAMGLLPDGRLGFVMQQIQGKTLMQVIQSVHQASQGGQWRSDVEGWSFRRLMDVYLRICETMAYAHSQSVIHLDLKSANVMLGAFGEVFVLDWGLNQIVDTPEQEQEGSQTLVGRVSGTPQFMAPEQARGEIQKIGPASDVYALGGMLFEILSGQPPIQEATTLQIIQAAGQGRIRPLMAPAPVPEAVEVILKRAMALEPQARYPHAAELAADVAAWLQGVRQQEEALKLVYQADQLTPDIENCRWQAQSHRRLAREKMEGIKPWEHVSHKKPAWAEEDAAERLEREATLKDLQRSQCLYAALNLVPTLTEAHARLADIYKDQLLSAEAIGDSTAVLRAELLLKTHDRGQYAALLEGLGRLTLQTHPKGARVKIFRYVEQDRRLVPVFEREEGPTPLSITLAQGSYLALIDAPGRMQVRYPFLIERGGHWDGLDPNGEQVEIYLPLEGALGPDDIYIPAGWFMGGGDAQALDPMMPRHWWVDAFVIKRFPVTCGMYLSFLNQLIQEGRREDAHVWAPRKSNQSGTELLWTPNANGYFQLRPDREGRPCTPEMAVNRINWNSAMAFANWMAQQEGRPWRLLHELEREKAGRGVDGRIFPWGRHLDASWAFIAQSHAGTYQPLPVYAFVEDESPYGVRWLAGGSSDFCINVYQREGYTGDRVIIHEEVGAFRAVRGGSWMSTPALARQASRMAAQIDNDYASVGMRIGYSLPKI